VAMAHTTRDGKPKIVKELTMPVSAQRCVDVVVTDIAVIEVTPAGLLLKELAPGWTPEEVQSQTGAQLIVTDDVKTVEL